jgi:hypothetical protein
VFRTGYRHKTVKMERIICAKNARGGRVNMQRSSIENSNIIKLAGIINKLRGPIIIHVSVGSVSDRISMKGSVEY